MWTAEPDERVDRVKRSAIWVEPDLDDILRVVEGKLEAIIDPTGKPWDHAPAVILVEEAGGRFSDGRGGRRIDLGEGRYTNGHIDEQLERLLAG
jgi:histidinol-phosphatase